MALSIEQFIKNLSDSSLMSLVEARAFQESRPADKKPSDGQELARELVRQKKLTKFQAEAVYKGNVKGLVLGNYIVLDKIGAGGMGQVFKAEHRNMKRIVALKVLPSAATKDAASVQRFQREAQAAAKLFHPNIITAYDAGEAGGAHFLVMEYMEASDLASRVKKSGPLPVETAVSCVLQAAQGLQYAHEQGVVHRDIKPANLLIDEKGLVKILDMGLARFDDGPGAAMPVGAAGLTQTGQILGTVDFMSPEQALDTRHADQRADIYSLGCTLFHLLTGKSTYGGNTIMQKLLAHREAPIPSLQACRDEIPAALDAVFQRMVAKKPDERYQSMSEVIAALESCGVDQSRQENPQTANPESSDLFQFEHSSAVVLQKRKTAQADDTIVGSSKTLSTSRLTDAGSRIAKKKPLLLGIALSAAALLLILGAVIFKLKTPAGTLVLEVNESDAVVQVMDEQGKVEITRRDEKGLLSITVEPGKHRLKVEKDGFQFFTRDFTMEANGQQSIKATLIPLENKKTVAVPQKPATAAPVEARVPAEGRELRKFVGHNGNVAAACLSADGRFALSGGFDKTLRLWDVATARELRKFEGHKQIVWTVALSPDGKYALSGSQDKSARLWEVESGKELHCWDGHKATVSGVAFLPDSRRAISCCWDTMVRLWDVESGAELKRLNFGTSVLAVSISPDGKRALFGATDGHLRYWDIDSGTELRRLECLKGSVEGVTISADGQRAAAPADKAVRVYDLTTGNVLRQFVGHTDNVESVAFAPDGRFLISCSADKTIRLWDIESGRELSCLKGHTGKVRTVVFTPDSGSALSAGFDGSLRLWALPK